MPKHKKLTHNRKVISALEKLKMPLFDEKRNLSIFFKTNSRSNETGIEHIAKSYHNLEPSDVELIKKAISNPIFHSKDKRFERTYCYYSKRKRDIKNYLKIVIKVEKSNPKVAFISSIYISSKLK